jgi:hypothetical protein
MLSQLAWYLTRSRARLTDEACAAIARLEQIAEAATVAALVRRFADLVVAAISEARQRSARQSPPSRPGSATR